jgi:hypothetical protein
MIRKLILSAVIATRAVAGLSATPSAAAAAPPVGHERERDFRGVRFEVQVRHRGHWDTYGTYRDREQARAWCGCWSARAATPGSNWYAAAGEVR